VLLAYFGEECDVRTLTENDQRAFVSKRLAGGIKVGDRETGKVRSRAAEAETKLFHTMLRWATTVRAGKGQRLLADNPLQGVRNVREEKPLRPVATWERFTKTREAARQLAEAQGSTPEQRREWIQLELALVIAEATGRRLGSIRQLRWDDWDFERHTIRWRGATDKKGHDAVIRVPEPLVNEVKSFRVKLGGAFGGLVFPSVADRDVAMSGDRFSSLLERAERHAGLSKLKGGLWHPYRRKWVTERKHLPLKDVAAALGSKDLKTLMTCYQQPDDETILAVMSEPKKVMEKAVSR
jgi:integrase